MKNLGIKKIILLVLLFIIASGLGAIIFERLLLPQLSTLPFLRNIKILDHKAPIVITRREEIRINEDINTQEVINRVRGALVKIYVHESKLTVSRPVAVVSGIIATNDGLILAPGSTIRNAANLTVMLENGEVYEGRLLFSDELSGISFVKITARDLPVLNEVISQNKTAGERLLVLSILEAQNVSTRSVSLRRPSAVQPSLTQLFDLTKFNADLSIDPALTEGESGSVIVDKDGSLVGMVTMLGRNITVIREEDLKLVLSNFLASGSSKVSWPALPANYLILGPVQAGLLDLPKRHGILVSRGAKGLEVGDFVFWVDGKDVSAADSFQALIFAKKAGGKAKLKLLRNSVEKEIEITL